MNRILLTETIIKSSLWNLGKNSHQALSELVESIIALDEPTKCQHSGCEETGDLIIVCDKHINEDYPCTCKTMSEKEIIKTIIEWDEPYGLLTNPKSPLLKELAKALVGHIAKPQAEEWCKCNPDPRDTYSCCSFCGKPTPSKEPTTEPKGETKIDEVCPSCHLQNIIRE